MSEQSIIEHTPAPNTKKSLMDDLRKLGLEAGMTVLMHSSMSNIGWISGGAQTVIEALLAVLGDDGTLMMPTHSAQNTNPANWQHPPIPQSWWEIERENRPVYDPRLTPTREMGAIPELFRTYPDVMRSDHPIGSFAAIGKHADYLIHNPTSLEMMFSDESPIGRLYELEGYVLLLGVGHGNNTSIHLAEYRADFNTKVWVNEACAMLVDGERQWVEFDMHDLDDEDFPQIGAEFAQKHGQLEGKVGQANAILVKQRPLVDFAVQWMEKNRT